MIPDVFGIQRGGPSRPPRLLVDATALDTGHRKRGIGRYVRGLLEGMQQVAPQSDLGERLTVLRLRAPAASKPTADDAASGAAALDLPEWRLRRPSGQHRVRWVINELLMSREIARSGAALYHSTEPWSAPVSSRFASVLTCHDIIPLLFPDEYLNFEHLYWRAYYAWMEKTRRWHKLTRILAISEATKQSLVERLDVDPTRIDVVYNGLDHATFRPVEDDAALDRVRQRYRLERPFVLYLGGYDFRKNIAALVEAMAEVPATLDCELVLAGGMSDETAAEFDAIARRHGIQERIRRLGYVDDADVPALYTLAQAFGYPSLAEGFGLQALEAMACGCPVVAADRTSLPEVVGEAGFLVDPTRPAAIGEALARLLDDDELRADYRQRGLERAQTFSWQRCARETLDVYRRAL